jgi:CubicO group peptidase (beta-lactamase class C family)
LEIGEVDMTRMAGATAHLRTWAAAVAAVVLTLAVGCTGSRAPSSLDERIDGFFEVTDTDPFSNVRALLVTAHGKPLVERYYGSSVSATGNLHSITKSVVATLIGIALDEGRLRGVDQTLGELLPSYARLMTPDVRTITLHQLLTMSAGLEPTRPGEAPPFVAAGDWLAGDPRGCARRLRLPADLHPGRRRGTPALRRPG